MKKHWKSVMLLCVHTSVAERLVCPLSITDVVSSVRHYSKALTGFSMMRNEQVKRKSEKTGTNERLALPSSFSP